MRGILFFALHPRRLLALLATLLAGIAYVWFAAVRAVPGVRRRKAAARAAWRERPRRSNAVKLERPGVEPAARGWPAGTDSRA